MYRRAAATMELSLLCTKGNRANPHVNALHLAPGKVYNRADSFEGSDDNDDDDDDEKPFVLVHNDTRKGHVLLLHVVTPCDLLIFVMNVLASQQQQRNSDQSTLQLNIARVIASRTQNEQWLAIYEKLCVHNRLESKRAKRTYYAMKPPLGDDEANVKFHHESLRHDGMSFDRFLSTIFDPNVEKNQLLSDRWIHWRRCDAWCKTALFVHRAVSVQHLCAFAIAWLRACDRQCGGNVLSYLVHADTLMDSMAHELGQQPKSVRMSLDLE